MDIDSDSDTYNVTNQDIMEAVKSIEPRVFKYIEEITLTMTKALHQIRTLSATNKKLESRITELENNQTRPVMTITDRESKSKNTRKPQTKEYTNKNEIAIYEKSCDIKAENDKPMSKQPRKNLHLSMSIPSTPEFQHREEDILELFDLPEACFISKIIHIKDIDNKHNPFVPDQKIFKLTINVSKDHRLVDFINFSARKFYPAGSIVSKFNFPKRMSTAMISTTTIH